MSATALKSESANPVSSFSRETLPGWTYNNAEFFALERRDLLLKNWQIVCHVNEVAKPGDYATLEMLGERAFVIRGDDGALRAFHNVCRHRAAAVVRGATGHCNQAIRCFYHGWAYELDGRLKALPAEATFANLNKADFGLKPLEIEIYMGFVFIRFVAGGAGVAERLAPYHDELAAYRIEEMVPWGRVWDVDIPVDWKNVMDNYLEGYHVPVGHPGLYRLFGTSYEVEARPGNIARAIGWLRDKESSNWTRAATTSGCGQRRRIWRTTSARAGATTRCCRTSLSTSIPSRWISSRSSRWRPASRGCAAASTRCPPMTAG